ncbi:chaperonin 10-like protein, partial [Mycena sanguinolenta]
MHKACFQRSLHAETESPRLMSLPRTVRPVICPSVPVSSTQLVYTTTHPMPQEKAGHVLIRIKGFGLNRSEPFTRQGLSPGVSFPRILEIECVGVLHDAGGGEWKEGDVVAAIMGGMGRQFDGGYAEYTLVPHSSVSPVGGGNVAAVVANFARGLKYVEFSSQQAYSFSVLLRKNEPVEAQMQLNIQPSEKYNTFLCIHVDGNLLAAMMRAKNIQTLMSDTLIVALVVCLILTNLSRFKTMFLWVWDKLAPPPGPQMVTVIGMLPGAWKTEFDPMAALAPGKHLTMFGSNSVDMSTAPLQQIVDAVGRGEIPLNVEKVFDMADAGEAHAYTEANSAAGKAVCLVE